MPFAIVTAEGEIKQVIESNEPGQHLEPGERIVRHDPPMVDTNVFIVSPRTPVAPDAAEVNFIIKSHSDGEHWLDPRTERNRLLAQSDWTQGTDSPLSEAGKAAWKVYRQELRDISEQPGFPKEVNWPISPDVEPR